MRLLLSALAIMMIAIPQAQASENRISVSEVHGLIQNLNQDLNNPNLYVGKGALNQLISSNATFDNNVKLYTPHWARHQVWYGQNVNPYYYRYPQAAHYGTQVSTRPLSKNELITQFTNKKQTIPGYQTKLSVTNIKMSPYARNAIVDIDVKEYSAGYNPYNPYAASNVMHANSKCRMYIDKQAHELFLTRMDCNTNTSLPL